MKTLFKNLGITAFIVLAVFMLAVGIEGCTKVHREHGQHKCCPGH